MGAPVIFGENYYNTIIFPNNLLSDTEEAVGHEIFHVADGRRSPFDYWTGITVNLAQALTVQNNVARTPNCVAVDRGHNLGGKDIRLDYSDNGSTWTALFQITIPTTVTVGASIDAAAGVLTEEGAWIKRFGGAGSHVWWRFLITSAVNYIPIVVGLWLGTAYAPPLFLTPWDEDQTDMVVQETVSEWAWRGRGPIALPRAGTIGIRLPTVSEYTNARYHIGQLFGKGRPTWIVYDDAQAERALLAIRPVGSHLSIGLETGWYPRQTRFTYVEHEPARP